MGDSRKHRRIVREAGRTGKCVESMRAGTGASGGVQAYLRSVCLRMPLSFNCRISFFGELGDVRLSAVRYNLRLIRLAAAASRRGAADSTSGSTSCPVSSIV